MNVLGLFTAFTLAVLIAAIFTNTGTSSSEAFAKGDSVTAFGNKGIVKSISSNGMFLEVAFDGASTTVVFNSDGKIHNWNKRPSLEKC